MIQTEVSEARQVKGNRWRKLALPVSERPLLLITVDLLLLVAAAYLALWIASLL